MIAIGLVLLGVLFLSFQTSDFYAFIDIFGIYFYWIYGFWRLFMMINKWRFRDYYLILENTGITIWYQSGVPSRLRSVMAICGTGF